MKFRPPHPVPMSLNLAPMVDVMMCLIIFFLLASKLVSAEHMPVNLPWAAAAKEVAARDLGDRVTINVRRPPDGSDARAEYVVVDWDGRRIVERSLAPEELEALLNSRKQRAAELGQALRCVIRADREVQYRHVEIVLRACGLAGVRHVVFSVNQGLPPEEVSP